MSTVAALDLKRPDHAYMFGFLQCDGHLSQNTRNRGKLSVELSAVDRSLLERFRDLVPFPSSITTRTRRTNFSEQHTSVVWTVCYLEFRRELIALGLPVGKKSQVVHPPSVEFSIVDYLRGLVDADGSVGLTSTGIPFVGFTTISDALKDFFLRSCPPGGRQRRVVSRNKRDDAFNVMVMREAAVELATTLYYEACLALPRKAEAAHRVQSWRRPSGMRKVSSKRWTAEEDRIALERTVAEAVRLLGRTPSSVTMRRWRLVTDDRIARRVRALRDPRLFYEPL